MTQLEKILKALERQTLNDSTLWNTNDIATYMRLSKSHVQKHIITATGFPRAIKLPTSENGGQRRWQPKEVKAWVSRFREAV